MPHVARDATNDVFGIVVLTCALLSLFLIPSLLAPCAIVLSAIAVGRKDRFGPLALLVGLLSAALVLYQGIRI